MKQKSKMLWFLMGLGNDMQIVASLSFTELFSLIVAPFLFMRYQQEMKRDGIMPLFYLSICVFFSCVIACYVNHTVFHFALRGYAVTAIIPCAIITSHWLIRRDPNGFKWFLLGAALSMVLCTFIFKKSVEIITASGGGMGGVSAEEIMSGPIYLIGRLSGFITLRTTGWYLHTPICFDVFIALSFAFFAILSNSSGRSMALSYFAFAAILLVGGKRMRTMKNRLCKKFWFLVVLSLVWVFAMKGIYGVAATQGWLGAEAQAKYEAQTKGDESLLALLMGGRMEFFCGLFACVDNPIVGFGPWAMDEDGYVASFLAEYGRDVDVETLEWLRVSRNTGRLSLIPGHSHIIEFWLWYGIFGLVFWLYILFVLIRYLKDDCWAVPQWFAWLACSIPGYFWSVFFSPLPNRFTPFLFVVACLMARSVRLGRFQLSREMQEEIWINEQKRR